MRISLAVLGKNALVFGGTKGIGLAIGRELIKDGRISKLVVVSRNPSNVDAALQILKDEAAHKECKIEGSTCDVSNSASIDTVMGAHFGAKSPLDISINAAGIVKDDLLIKASEESIRQTINVNLIGSILTSKATIRSMIKTKTEGSILNIGSIIGLNGNAGQVAYSASKSGLMGLTKSLAKEVGSRGIRVNLIAPGFIHTDMTSSTPIKEEQIIAMTPLKRMGNPEEVAGAAIFLVYAKFITGAVLTVDGGLHLNM